MKMKAAFTLVPSDIEKIKGEPFLPDFKGTCKMCRYKCIYAGKDQSDLPEWLRD
jgi:hypothetical protein